jgi:predicted Zn finger-like uncharacterized protein
MKIECPSCQLAGKINELELPPTGRELICPRCKKSFQVAKPPAVGGVAMMGSCPSCQYSTFGEEMFTVCPKCGLSAEEGQILSRKLREREQLQRDQEALHRSLRNPDLVQAPARESAAEPPRAAQAVELTAWLCGALGAALLCYGAAGLFNYYRKDWQAVLSEPMLVPVSRLYVFFSLGLLPWLATLFSLHFTWAAYRFAKLAQGSLGRLTESAWAGVALVVIYQAVAFFNWARVSSSTPSLSYYAVGVLNCLVMIALMGAPFYLLLWHLKRDTIVREFKKARAL